MVSEFEFCETSTLNISPINSYVSILLPIKNLWEHNRWNHWFLHDEQWPKYEEVCSLFIIPATRASIGMWNQLLRLNREFCVLHESKVSVVADEEEQVKGAPPRVYWMFWIDSTTFCYCCKIIIFNIISISISSFSCCCIILIWLWSCCYYCTKYK